MRCKEWWIWVGLVVGCSDCCYAALERFWRRLVVPSFYSPWWRFDMSSFERFLLLLYVVDQLFHKQTFGGWSEYSI